VIDAASAFVGDGTLATSVVQSSTATINRLSSL